MSSSKKGLCGGYMQRKIFNRAVLKMLKVNLIKIKNYVSQVNKLKFTIP